MYHHQSHSFKTRLLGRNFHTLIRNVSFHPPPWGLVSSLAYHSVSDFDTICNRPSSLLADIVRFGPVRIVVSLTVLKHVYHGDVSTPLLGIVCSPLHQMWGLISHSMSIFRCLWCHVVSKVIKCCKVRWLFHEICPKLIPMAWWYHWLMSLASILIYGFYRESIMS